MGPAPVTSTSSPRTGKASAVWTALPSGSKMAATSMGDAGGVTPDVGHGQDDVFGEGAGAVDADALGVGAEMAAAGEAVAAASADDVAFAADELAGLKSVTLEPTATISPTNSWPMTRGTGDGRLRPGVPVVDVEVGAADAGLEDANLDVVDADLGLGDVFEPETFFGARLDQGFHWLLLSYFVWVGGRGRRI